MSNQFRVCESSTRLFGGFRCKLDLDGVDSVEEIIILAISYLKHHLFEVLVEKVDKTNWHIHSNTFENILINKNDKIWICDHCTETIIS